MRSGLVALTLLVFNVLPLVRSSVASSAPGETCSPPPQAHGGLPTPAAVAHPGSSLLQAQATNKRSLTLALPGGETLDPVASRHHREALVVSLMLFGSVAFVMSIFYLVNYEDADLQLHTWKTLNITTSIFVSVLLYGSIEAFVLQIFHMGFGHPRRRVIINLALYLAFDILCRTVFFALRKRYRRYLVAVSTIMGHINGFMALYGFAGLQDLPPFNRSFYMSGVVVVIALLVLATRLGIAQMGRNKYLKTSDPDAEETLMWLDQVEEMEYDVCSFCIGFLTMQVVRFWICGSLQPYQATEAADGITQARTNWLLFFSLFFATTTWLASYFTPQYLDSDLSPRGVLLSPRNALLFFCRRLFRILGGVNSLAFAWCLMFWCKWELYALGYYGMRIVACIIVALTCTGLCVLGILLLKSLAKSHKHTEKLELTLGVLVGFSWERAFHIALHDVGHGLSGTWCSSATMVHICSLSLVLVVMPAWDLYILPMSRKPIEYFEERVKAARVASESKDRWQPWNSWNAMQFNPAAAARRAQLLTASFSRQATPNSRKSSTSPTGSSPKRAGAEPSTCMEQRTRCTTCDNVLVAGARFCERCGQACTRIAPRETQEGS